MTGPRITIALAIIAIACGCSFTSNTTSDSAQSTVLTKRSEEIANAKKDSLRMRWFPVDDAAGYRIDVESPTGALLHQETVQPSGCTHQLRDGHTSGVCSLVYKLPEIDGQYILRLRALDKQGGAGAPSEQFRPASQ